MYRILGFSIEIASKYHLDIKWATQYIFFVGGTTYAVLRSYFSLIVSQFFFGDFTFLATSFCSFMGLISFRIESL